MHKPETKNLNLTEATVITKGLTGESSQHKTEIFHIVGSNPKDKMKMASLWHLLAHRMRQVTLASWSQTRLCY